MVQKLRVTGSVKIGHGSASRWLRRHPGKNLMDYERIGFAKPTLTPNYLGLRQEIRNIYFANNE